MPRVRLLRPVLITVRSVDPTATRAEDPAGPDTSGYDDPWRTPVRYIDPTTKERTSATQFQTREFLAQVEDNVEHQRRYDAAGDFPDYDILLVAHVRDLTRRGYIGSDGSPVMQIGDRVTQARNRRSGAVQATWDDLWIVEIRHASWGFGAGRDLILFACSKREQPA